jgi:hypothetical protein
MLAAECSNPDVIGWYRLALVDLVAGTKRIDW